MSLAAQVFEMETSISIPDKQSYILSYPHMLGFFSSKSVLTESDIVVGSHMVYGWMPTIIDIYYANGRISLAESLPLFNSAKQGKMVSKTDLDRLKCLINNSLVGLSKLLHFISPSTYPIWDSKIYFFLHRQKPYQYQIGDPSRYLHYVDVVKGISEAPGFHEFHRSVNRKIGYDVSPCRAIELVMFIGSSTATFK
jgi:hypothetical protein